MKNYKKGFANIIGAIVIGAIAVIAGAFLNKVFTPKVVIQTPIVGPKVGAAPTFTSGKLYTLYGGGISSTDTSIKLSSFQSPVANIPLTTTDLINGVGAKFYLTIEPATNRKETVGCTIVTQNADGTAVISGCTRGYMFTYPYTASTTLQLSHSGGSRAILSDSPQLYNDIISYVNTITAAGVVDSSATAKGIVEKATAAEAASHAAVGSGNTTAPLALDSSIASSSRVANTSVVMVSSSTSGYIDDSFIATSTTQGTNLFKSLTLTGTTTISTASITALATTTGFIPLVKVAETTLTSAATSITVSSIPVRKSLYIVFDTPGFDGDGTDMVFTFNADGGANYGYQHSLNFSATPVSANAQTGINFGTDTGAASRILIIDVNDTLAKPKSILYRSTLSNTTSAPNVIIGAASWNNTTAYINSVTVTLTTNNLLAGTRLTVYSAD